MGVKVRERPKGSGMFWVFIDHQGKRKAKKIGKNKKLAIAYQQRGLNTTSWSYWTNSSGTRMLNRKKKWRV